MSKKKTYLAVDIGTENLKVALCTQEKGEVDIIGYSNLKQQFSSMRSAFIVNVDQVISNIDIATGNCIAMAKKTVPYEFSLPTEMVIGIAGELVLGSSVQVEIERDNPDSVITQREFNDLAEQVMSDTFPAVAEQLAEEVCLDSVVLEHVNSTITNIKIDGVIVQDPVGHKALNIEINIFISFAPRVHLEILEKIAKQFKMRAHKPIVEPYAIANSLEVTTGKTGSAVIVDIGGGTTDVAVVSGGDFLGAKMYSIGGRVFTEAISKHFKLDLEEAEKLKINYSSDKLPDTKKAEVASVINEVVRIWADGLLITLQTIQEGKEIPPVFYFCGGGSLLPEIQDIVMSYPWQSKLNIKKHPKFSYIFPNKIIGVTDKTRLANNINDVAALALSKYI